MRLSRTSLGDSRVCVPVAVALAVALTVASPVKARAETHVVVVEGMQFTPATLTVKRGDTVTWQNKDLVPHTATAAGRFDSGGIAAGKSWSWQPAAAGRFDYVCTYHLGMKGTLVVQ
jgi:plastocyanin